MATNSLAREELWRKLKIAEENYYLCIAKYCYLMEGIKAPPRSLVKRRANLLANSFILETTPLPDSLTFKISKLDVEHSWTDLIAAENKYYQCRVEFDLFEEGIESPTDEQIKEKIKVLSQIELRKSLFLGKSLTEKEIECIAQASLGKNPKETASRLGISEPVVKKHRGEAYRKFHCSTMQETIYFATRLGYLPFKKMTQTLQPTKLEEVENACV